MPKCDGCGKYVCFECGACACSSACRWKSIRESKPQSLEIVLVWLPKQKVHVCLRYDPRRDKKKWTAQVWDEEGPWASSTRDSGQFKPIIEEVNYWMALPEAPNE